MSLFPCLTAWGLQTQAGREAVCLHEFCLPIYVFMDELSPCEHAGVCKGPASTCATSWAAWLDEGSHTHVGVLGLLGYLFWVWK